MHCYDDDDVHRAHSTVAEFSGLVHGNLVAARDRRPAGRVGR